MGGGQVEWESWMRRSEFELQEDKFDEKVLAGQ